MKVQTEEGHASAVVGGLPRHKIYQINLTVDFLTFILSYF